MCIRDSVQGSTAPPIEVWIKPFQRFAGSQGSALSRIPQDAESPFETRGSARVSTNSRFKRRPQAARLFCAQSALMKTNLRIGFQFCPCRLSPEQSGGLETLLRRRTKGSFKKGTENQRMDNLRFSSIAKRYATGISFTVRSKIAYRRSPRVRTPAAYFKAHSRPFATPFSRSPFMTWPSKSATALWENAPQGHFLIPQGELRTADV